MTQGVEVEIFFGSPSIFFLENLEAFSRTYNQ